MRINQPLLGLLDDIEDRRFAVCVAVHTNTKIDFFRARVVPVLSNQAQDGIRGTGLQRFKQGLYSAKVILMGSEPSILHLAKF